jgi:hypothetical protein
MTSGAKLKAIGEMFGKQQDILGNELIEVTNPDGSRSARRKTYEDLTSKEKEKYDSLDEGMLKLDQLFVAETGLGELDVKNPEFESLFNTRYKEPMTKAIQSVIPEFKGFNVKFGEGKDFRKKYFSENDNTAEWDPETKTMYFDKDKYNSGKPLHEFTHVVLLFSGMYWRGRQKQYRQDGNSLNAAQNHTGYHLLIPFIMGTLHNMCR